MTSTARQRELRKLARQLVTRVGRDYPDALSVEVIRDEFDRRITPVLGEARAGSCTTRRHRQLRPVVEAVVRRFRIEAADEADVRLVRDELLTGLTNVAAARRDAEAAASAPADALAGAAER